MSISFKQQLFDTIPDLNGRLVKTSDLTPTSFVLSGLATPVPSSTLTGVMSAGVAFIGGMRAEKLAGTSGLTFTYAVSSDTYNDIDAAGAITRVVTANGVAPAAVVTGKIRLEKVVTSATVITSVSRIAAYRPNLAEKGLSGKIRSILIGDSIQAQNHAFSAVTITSTNGVGTVNYANHFVLIGQTVQISKSPIPEQNGFFAVASIIDASNFTYNHGTGSGSSGTNGAEALSLNRMLADGPFNIFNALTGQRHIVIRNYSRSAAKTQDIIDALNNFWVDEDIDEAFVQLGVNDATNAIPVATITANLATIYNFLLRKGIKTNIQTTFPMHSSHASFAGNQTTIAKLVEFQKFFAANNRNVDLQDTHQALLSPTSLTGSAKDFVLRDGLHPGEPGAYYSGKKMGDDKYKGALVVPAGLWPTGPLDGYNNNSASWNMLPNPMMLLGAGGTLVGAVGTVAEGVIATHTAASASSCTCSLAARADGGNDQRMVFVSTASAQFATLSYATIHTQLTAGKTYRLGANVKLSGMSNVDYILYEVLFTAGGFSGIVRALSPGISAVANFNEFEEVTQDLWLESVPFVLPASVTSALVSIKVLSTGTGGATIDFGRPKFEEVRY